MQAFCNTRSGFHMEKTNDMVFSFFGNTIIKLHDVQATKNIVLLFSELQFQFLICIIKFYWQITLFIVSSG